MGSKPPKAASLAEPKGSRPGQAVRPASRPPLTGSACAWLSASHRTCVSLYLLRRRSLAGLVFEGRPDSRATGQVACDIQCIGTHTHTHELATRLLLFLRDRDRRHDAPGSGLSTGSGRREVSLPCHHPVCAACWRSRWAESYSTITLGCIIYLKDSCNIRVCKVLTYPGREIPAPMTTISPTAPPLSCHPQLSAT